MQEFVFFISGRVKKALTIDPTVWIFDERKVDLETFFQTNNKIEEDELTTYTRTISKQWDKEMTQGVEPPNPNRDTNRIRYDRQALTNGSFGMPLNSFFRNAEPDIEATAVEIETSTGETFCFSQEEAYQLIAAFSKSGKPLKEDGPVHLYLADGSNEEEPIRNVQRIVFV
ncbi:hypothetical protein [Shouchella shacheensis]|uniref:hypothetical protein n=1 Tax=Shouchella shacheensis TaxID=1649580 RepID=UPI00073FDEA0|nr:hypothetical protein [Shouchella shacheensis]